jgi:hypothetical protein
VACFANAGTVYSSLLSNARNSRKSSHASLVNMLHRRCVSCSRRNNSSSDVFIAVSDNQQYNRVYCAVGAEAI